MTSRLLMVSICATLIGSSVTGSLRASDASTNSANKDGAGQGEPVPLNKSKTVLVDLKGKRLLIKSEVVLREGLLEMLVCLKQTKEHESILSVDARAQVIHAGLISLGAEAGSPAKFIPDYKPASGQPIDIFLTWTDAEGKLHRDRAQTWVRHATRRYFVHKLEAFPKGLKLAADSDLKWDDRNKELLWYGPMTDAQRDSLLKLTADVEFKAAIKSLYDRSQVRQMDANWVFAGSGFSVDSVTGEKRYLAESGDLICVANFATATIDLSVESSATNDGLMFEAFTERIPPVGTKVTIELVPLFKKPGKAASN